MKFIGLCWQTFLNYVLFCGLVKPSREKLCVNSFDWTTTSHAKMNLATEIQHTDFSYHCKDFEGKEWSIFLLYQDKKGFSALFTKKCNACKGKAVKVISEAWPHCSKGDARGRKKNRFIKLQKLYIYGQKKAAIERTTQLVPKKQFGCLQ